MSEGLDFTPFAEEIFKQCWDELLTRVDGLGDLPDADAVAISTAVGKAAWRGVLRGMALVTHEINQKSSTQVDLVLNRPEDDTFEPDAWAEQYGQDA
jgi:hypothetical protein